MGEMITTTYSFVATALSLRWNSTKSVFVTIDPNFLNLDPAMVEAAFTSGSMANLLVHCYGITCDVNAIQAIASEPHLKVIDDTAHAFGLSCHGGSVLNHGDPSVVSFHVTKLFNTFEGGDWLPIWEDEADDRPAQEFRFCR